jgi:hypothetical protein
VPVTGGGLADTDAEPADLGRLAFALLALDYDSRLVAGRGRETHLHLRNPRAEIMTERIYVRGEFFTWPWGDPVAPRNEVIAAARIARVLRAVGQPGP